MCPMERGENKQTGFCRMHAICGVDLSQPSNHLLEGGGLLRGGMMRCLINGAKLCRSPIRQNLRALLCGQHLKKNACFRTRHATPTKVSVNFYFMLALRQQFPCAQINCNSRFRQTNGTSFKQCWNRQFNTTQRSPNCCVNPGFLDKATHGRMALGADRRDVNGWNRWPEPFLLAV